MMQTHQRPLLTEQAFTALGLNAFAYIKPVQHEGADAYSVHTADGQQVAIAANRDLAFALIRQNDLEPVDAH